MNPLEITLQLALGLGILNVWLIRFNQRTPYRGGISTSLRDEFRVYGFPSGVFYIVGFIKVTAAIALIVGIFHRPWMLPASGVLAVAMLVALLMHVKVKDHIIKSVPAALMLVMSLLLSLG